MSDTNGWIKEKHQLWPGQMFCLEYKETIFHERSEFQEIEVYESTGYGRVLLLDGVIQCTERDEAAYQEVITHIPLCSLKAPPKRVLVIGGGDGGVARELTRYSSIERIDVAEIDRMVVEVSKKYLSGMSIGFSDPRVHVHICDGLDFVKNAQEGYYDAIVVDSSDPTGPAEVLFQKPFFESLHRAIRPGGVISTQAECLFLHLELVKGLAIMCSSVFQGGSVSYASTSVPTYPSGEIGFLICIKKEEHLAPHSPLTPVALYFESEAQKHKLRYYNKGMHHACFCLPQFALDVLSPILTFQ